MLILMQFLGSGAKNQGGWSNSQGKNRRAGPVSVTVALPCDVTVHAQSSVRGSVVRAGGVRV